jgi:hypothetical protein
VSGFGFRAGAVINPPADFGTKTTLGINELPVSFDSGIHQLADMKVMRISESGHQPPVA